MLQYISKSNLNIQYLITNVKTRILKQKYNEIIMLQIENELKNIIINIPPKFRSTILQYAKTIKLRAEKGELSDTEYLEKIPGMSKSIVKESKIDRNKYTENLDW